MGSKSPPMAETLRWGILSTAGIARKNWEAIRNSGNGTITAVASRDAAKAQGQFIHTAGADFVINAKPGQKGEVIEVEDIGTGFLMIKREVINDGDDDRHWKHANAISDDLG